MFAEGVTYRKPFQLSNQFFGAAVKILERRVLYLVDAFDLADQQFGIADQLEGFGTMLQSVFEGCDQALILGEIVGLVAEVLAELCNFASRLILDDYAIASWARVAARATVAVGDQMVLRRSFAMGVFAMGKERSGSDAAR